MLILYKKQKHAANFNDLKHKFCNRYSVGGHKNFCLDDIEFYLFSLERDNVDVEIFAHDAKSYHDRKDILQRIKSIEVLIGHYLITKVLVDKERRRETLYICCEL